MRDGADSAGNLCHLIPRFPMSTTELKARGIINISHVGGKSRVDFKAGSGPWA